MFTQPNVILSRNPCYNILPKPAATDRLKTEKEVTREDYKSKYLNVYVVLVLLESIC